MRIGSAIPALVALCLATTGAAWAQTAATPANPPPERLQGTTTQNNPATAATPAPSSPMASTSSTSATPSNNAVNTAPQNNPGAPLPGANSFTESEARGRIENSGYSQVSALKLDSKGVWRGNAMKDGKSMAVALDYQGNIVAE